MDKMQPISQALYSLLFLGCMGAGFPLYVQGQNVDELPPDSIYNIGYARGSLKNISGSVEQITEKQMNRELITNPLEAIQGRVPGLTILKSNNGMAALESVRLRGTTSLTSGNDPLIIVDGVLGDDDADLGISHRYRVFYDFEGCVGNGAVWFTWSVGSH